MTKWVKIELTNGAVIEMPYQELNRIDDCVILFGCSFMGHSDKDVQLFTDVKSVISEDLFKEEL